MFRYRIDVQEELSEAWSDWFEGWRFQINSVRHTELTGAVREQTELHGVLAKIRICARPCCWSKLSTRAKRFHRRTQMLDYICQTCGTQFSESAAPPARCPICEDERQYIGWGGG